MISCSTSSKEIVGLYVSPLQYADYSCNQIKSEMIRVSTKVKSLTGELDENKENHQMITGAGIVFFGQHFSLLVEQKNKKQNMQDLKVNMKHLIKWQFRKIV